MSREKCGAAVEVLLGHGADEGALVECDRDLGHANPDRAIGSLPVELFHRAEWTDTAYAGVQAADAAGTPIRIVITWPADA